MAKPSYAARRHATKELVFEMYPHFSWVVTAMLTLQVLAYLQMCGIVCWNLSFLLVALPCLLTAFGLSAWRDGDWTSSWQVPANLLHASRHSAFGVEPKQAPARAANAWICIQGFALCALLAAAAGVDRECWHAGGGVPGSTEEAECRSQGVPLWLPCGKVAARAYGECVAACGWLRSSFCGAIPAMNHLSHDLPNGLDVVSACALGPTCWLPWALLAALSSGCRRQCVWNVPRHDQALRRIEARAREIDRSLADGTAQVFDSPAWVYYEALLYLVDGVILDPLASATLFHTHNHLFGAIGLAVFAKTMYAQVRRGSIQKLRQEVKSSAKRGLMTDDLFFLLQSEKLQEAPLAALLQFFAFPYVSFQDTALVTFAISIAFSVRSIVKGIYIHYHLGINVFDDEVDSSEEELLGDAGSQTAVSSSSLEEEQDLVPAFGE